MEPCGNARLIFQAVRSRQIPKGTAQQQMDRVRLLSQKDLKLCFFFKKKEIQFQGNIVSFLCCVYVIQQSDMCVYTGIFISFPIMVCHRILNTVSVLKNRIFLAIHSVYNILHLLVPNSQPILPPPPTSLTNKNLFSVSMSLKKLFFLFKEKHLGYLVYRKQC